MRPVKHNEDDKGEKTGENITILQGLKKSKWHKYGDNENDLTECEPAVGEPELTEPRGGMHSLRQPIESR